MSVKLGKALIIREGERLLISIKYKVTLFGCFEKISSELG